MKKIKCFFGKHEIVRVTEDWGRNTVHSFECKHCGKVKSFHCVPKLNPYLLFDPIDYAV